jgi:hypothetical protein
MYRTEHSVTCSQYQPLDFMSIQLNPINHLPLIYTVYDCSQKFVRIRDFSRQFREFRQTRTFYSVILITADVKCFVQVY